jgi:cysteine desulfurase family protein
MDYTAYFDNAATTFPKPEEVYTFTDRFYRECGVNVGRGQHKLAARAAALVAETRQLLLELCHCPNKSVVFTHTATEALNTIIRGSKWRDGMNVYVSPFEHNSVTRTLHLLSKSYGLKFIDLAFDKESGSYDMGAINRHFIHDKPHMVIVSHASNVCGVMAPIVEIAKAAKSHGAITVFDMCQTMGLVDTDLNSEAIDYAVFAGHKTLYSPFGVAGFIGKPTAVLAPLIYGGTGVDSASPELPETVPERYEAASPNIQAIAGLNASLHWIKETGIDNIFRKEQANRKRLVDLLNQYDNIRIVPQGNEDNFIGVVSCVFDGYGSDNIGQILSDKNVAVRTGLHCAPTAHRFLGTFPSGTVRFSVSYFNNDDDFALLVDALSYIHENS